MNRETLAALEPLVSRVVRQEGRLVIQTQGLEEITMSDLNELCKLYLPIDVIRPVPVVLTGVNNLLFGDNLRETYHEFQINAFSFGFRKNELTFGMHLSYALKPDDKHTDTTLEKSIQLSGKAERYHVCRILSQIALDAPVYKFRDQDFDFIYDGKRLEIALVDEVGNHVDA